MLKGTISEGLANVTAASNDLATVASLPALGSDSVSGGGAPNTHNPHTVINSALVPACTYVRMCVWFVCSVV